MNGKLNIKKIIILSMLTAIEVILSRFLSINAWNMKFSLSFIILMMTGMLFGAFEAGLVGAVSDFIGAILFPTGAYFPGFTLTGLLNGLIFGAFLHKKPDRIKLVSSVLITQLFMSLLLNSFWLSILYMSPFSGLFFARILQTVIMTVVEIAVGLGLLGILPVSRKGLLQMGVSGVTGVTGNDRQDSLPAETRPMNYDEAIAYINDFTWSKSRPGLSRTFELLRAMGDPQKKLKFIHVTGSNGKGSTCAILDSVLRSQGYTTGLYTSPYICDFCERIRVNGVNIKHDVLASITDKVRIIADKMADHPSQFELVTAIAFEYFLREKCDIVVLEVGMGGALDSTNVIDCPEVAVFTNIGLEHTEYLGSTVEEIATTKGGIIKAGCSVVCYDSGDASNRILKNISDSLKVPFRLADFGAIEPISHDLNGQVFKRKDVIYHFPLLGSHQLRNAEVAFETLEVLRERGYNISDEAILRGFENVRWIARFEVLSHDPLFILDGGHNPQCAGALADVLREYLPDRKITFIMGVLADKDYRKMIDSVSPYASRFVCLTPESPRALDAQELAEILQNMGYEAVACKTAAEAIEEARRTGEPIVAFGSLYMAGSILNEFNTAG